MSTTSKIILGIVSFVLLIFIVGCSVTVGIHNNCITQEASIKAQYKQNQNNYDNYFKKIKEISQVPEMYVADLKKVWDSVMAGRYGKNGSKATWQWLKEHNPKLDASMYHKIQSVIEAGRIDFEVNQKMLLDKKRLYEDTYLKVFPTGTIATVLGFPKIDIASMDIITSNETDAIFKNKKSEPIRLR